MIYPIHSTDFEESFPIQLQLFGVNHLQEYVSRPSGVPYYQWFYCVKGQGELLLNHQRFLISQGQGFLIFPDVPHTYQGVTSNWTLHVFGFTGALCPELLRLLQMHESGAYYFSDSNLFIQHIQKLLWLYENRTKERTLSCSKECYDFLLDLSQCIRHSYSVGSMQENELVQTIITYLEKNHPSPVSLTDIASVVNLSRDYMCALFKQHTGQTIMQCLLSIRLGHARHLLIQHPETRICDIGQMCGFESPSYFGKKFKSEVGMTPEQYRKNW